MKCLLVSDLHYTLKQFDWLHAVAERFDLLVLAGDHLDISSTVPVDVQIVVILKYLRRLAERTRVIVCSGNHDLNARSAGGERVAAWMARARDIGVPVDGDFLELGGVAITVCPWWDGPASCAEVGAQLARDAARRTGRWIWVYHAPPDESPVSWAGQRHFGDAELLRWIRIYQPDVVLTGHIHQSPFRAGGSWVDQIGSTWVFNAGRQIGPCPSHVTIDLAGGPTAMWFSLAGNEVVRLDAPLTRPVARVIPP
jgi:Icc-related predicted phosphoesterase